MADIFKELNRNLIIAVDAASVAAGTDFVAFNLENIGGKNVYIDSIDVVVNASAADFANLINIQAEIVKNVILNPNIALAPQVALGRAIGMWRGRSKVPSDRAYEKSFENGGFILIPDSSYSIFAFASFGAALGGIITLTLSVVGRYGSDAAMKQQMYGTAR
jgi:hypothetical protein